MGIGSLLFAVTVATSAAAQQPPSSADQEARDLFGAGIEAYDRGVFGAALEYFERAYALSHRSQMLFNVGLAAQRSGRHERAIEAFEQYLRAVPDAPNRGDVHARIEEVQSRMQAGQPPPDQPPPPVVDGEGPSALPWIVMGGSGAVLVTGVVLFAMAQGDISAVEGAADGSSWTGVRDGYDRAPTFSTIGLVLAGVGAAGVAVGVVLLTSGGGQSEVIVGLGGVAVRGRF